MKLTVVYRFTIGLDISIGHIDADPMIYGELEKSCAKDYYDNLGHPKQKTFEKFWNDYLKDKQHPSYNQIEIIAVLDSHVQAIRFNQP